MGAEKDELRRQDLRDPRDPTDPLYDAELGFRPCRLEWCRRIPAHPRHTGGRMWRRDAQRARVRDHMRRMRDARGDQSLAIDERRAAERREFERATLTRLGISPVREIRTESGKLLLQEWRCLICDGRGWIVNAGVACRECRGRGVVSLEISALISALARAGRL